ncbi:efflux RND transporter periplasmic adaptor subunit [Candidatus Sumerlaeota bacterium]|nr:efflux RND transporter periplasmic adaptor subunit [Candidatus Sumerlaeota bacterium]MBI3735347.1 efflux RND transporter periplasmic adaptor subunit [Candidatus Sumerlaeota bacterium]
MKSTLRKILFFVKFLEIRLRFVAILVVTALVVGYWDHVQNYYERWQRERHAHEHRPGETEAPSAAEEMEYFCPMHPFVVRDKKGKCPICGMDLVPRKKGAKTELPEGTLARVQVSPERIVQGGVEVEPVKYRLLANSLRAFGSVELDETRVSRIIARFPGRVEELKVDAVGLEVKKGDLLARLYSPKFLAASEEYAQAVGAWQRAMMDQKVSEESKTRAGDIAAFARQRLALAGFTAEQLDEIAEKGISSHYVTLFSPLAGTVLEKKVLLGDMVEEGSGLYTIADLSSLWIQAQVLEADIAAIKRGMPVEISTVSRPGEKFYGVVDFIYPTVNSENRSVKVRIVVANKEGKLRPGMYTVVEMKSPMGEFAELGDKEKAGMKMTGEKEKEAPPDGHDLYYCPMHPEVTSDKPGKCEKCGGMALVKKEPAPAAEEGQWVEGFTCPMHPDILRPNAGKCDLCGCAMDLKLYRAERVLSIRETAVIDTGARQIVYVESAPGIYDARAVTLGPRAGEYYRVIEGLKETDRVVARGAFLIDAESRLNAGTQAQSE